MFLRVMMGRRSDQGAIARVQLVFGVNLHPLPSAAIFPKPLSSLRFQPFEC